MDDAASGEAPGGKPETAVPGGLLAQLLDEAPAGMALIGGPRREFLFVNRLFAELSALDPGEMLGRTVREVFPTIRLFIDRIEEIFATGEGRAPTEIRGRVPAGGGEPPALQLSYRPFRGQDGEVAAVAVFVVDVTAAVRARDDAEARANQQERAFHVLQQIIDQMPDGVIFADAEGKVVLQNRAARALYGPPPPDGGLAGRLIHRGVPFAPGDRPVVRSALYGEEFPPQRMVAEFEDTGKQTPVLVTSVPIRDPDGNLLGAMSTHQDITDIVEAERRKDEFLAIVGHELRSPLGQIEAIAKAIAERGEDLEAGLRGELLNDLGHSAARALNLVNNLLVLGRAEVGQSLAPEPLLVSRAVAAMARDLGEQQNRTVRVTSADDGLIASVASTVFERVAVNLIGNALKYSPTHTDVEVVVECDRDEAVVRVLDRGIGLSEDDVDQIFEPYHRSERAASYAAGVGVGLTVCMRLVKSQGGRIWAAPRPGGGAEFGFAFPRYRDGEDL